MNHATQRFWKVSLDVPSVDGTEPSVTYFDNQLNALRFGEAFSSKYRTAQHPKDVFEFVARVTDRDELKRIQDGEIEIFYRLPDEFEGVSERTPECLLKAPGAVVRVGAIYFEKDGVSRNLVREPLEFAFESEIEAQQFHTSLMHSSDRLSRDEDARDLFVPIGEVINYEQSMISLFETERGHNVEIVPKRRTSEIFDLLEGAMKASIPGKDRSGTADQPKGTLYSVAVSVYDGTSSEPVVETWYFESLASAELLIAVLSKTDYFEKGNILAIDDVPILVERAPDISGNSRYVSIGENADYVDEYFASHFINEEEWKGHYWGVDITDNDGNVVKRLAFLHRESALKFINEKAGVYDLDTAKGNRVALNVPTVSPFALSIDAIREGGGMIGVVRKKIDLTLRGIEIQDDIEARRSLANVSTVSTEIQKEKTPTLWCVDVKIYKYNKTRRFGITSDYKSFFFTDYRDAKIFANAMRYKGKYSEQHSEDWFIYGNLNSPFEVPKSLVKNSDDIYLRGDTPDILEIFFEFEKSDKFQPKDLRWALDIPLKEKTVTVYMNTLQDSLEAINVARKILEVHNLTSDSFTYDLTKWDDVCPRPSHNDAPASTVNEVRAIVFNDMNVERKPRHIWEALGFDGRYNKDLPRTIAWFLADSKSFISDYMTPDTLRFWRNSCLDFDGLIEKDGYVEVIIMGGEEDNPIEVFRAEFPIDAFSSNQEVRLEALKRRDFIVNYSPKRPDPDSSVYSGRRY